MGRIYTIIFDGVSVTAATGDQDFFSIVPAANKKCGIIGIHVGNVDRIQDAQEDMLRWAIIRGNTTVGSGGTAPTPQLNDGEDGAAGFTARVNDTTPASAGTPTTNHADSFNVRTGLIYQPTPKQVIWCSVGQTRICVRLLEAVLADTIMSGTLYVEEF